MAITPLNLSGKQATQQATLTYQLPANASTFTLTLNRRPPNTSLQSLTGFTRAGTDTYRWTGNTTTPTLTFTFSGVTPPNRSALWGDTWALSPRLTASHRLTHAGVTYCGSFTDPLVNVSTTAPSGWAASVTPHKLFISGTAHVERTSQLAGGERIHVIRRNRTYPGVNASRRVSVLLGRVNRTSARLDVGCRRNSTWIVAPPDGPVGGTTTLTGSDEPATVWVSGKSIGASDARLWVHEYLHTRQCFQTTSRMAWFTEASAKYYGVVSVYQTEKNRVTYNLPGIFGGTYPNSTLADPTTWTVAEVPYEKGAQVLLYLEYQFETNGSGSVEALFRWMNHHPDRVTYPEFRAWVVNHTSPSTGRWLDAHVAANETVRVADRHTAILDGDQYTLPPTPTPDQNTTTTCTLKTC